MKRIRVVGKIEGKKEPRLNFAPAPCTGCGAPSKFVCPKCWAALCRASGDCPALSGASGHVCKAVQ